MKPKKTNEVLQNSTMADLSSYFTHRVPSEFTGDYDAVNAPLERAAAIVELLEIVGAHHDQNEALNFYRAAEAIRLEILDAQALLEYYRDRKTASPARPVQLITEPKH